MFLDQTKGRLDFGWRGRDLPAPSLIHFQREFFLSFILEDRVRESSSTTGTGPITLAGAPAGYRSFSSVMSNGDTTWYALVLPGGAWETGVGTWVTGNTLQRTTVLRSSNANALVNFGAGTKDVFIALPASKGNVQNNTFPSGTLMLFQQTNAPLYWTKQVTHNDKALRVVSGAVGSGGNNAFSAALNGARVVGNTTITNATMPSHSHSISPQAIIGGTSGAGGVGGGGNFGQQGAQTALSAGGDGTHNHAFNIDVQYVDLIICSKD